MNNRWRYYEDFWGGKWLIRGNGLAPDWWIYALILIGVWVAAVLVVLPFVGLHAILTGRWEGKSPWFKGLWVVSIVVIGFLGFTYYSNPVVLHNTVESISTQVRAFLGDSIFMNIRNAEPIVFGLPVVVGLVLLILLRRSRMRIFIGFLRVFELLAILCFLMSIGFLHVSCVGISIQTGPTAPGCTIQLEGQTVELVSEQSRVYRTSSGQYWLVCDNGHSYTRFDPITK